MLLLPQELLRSTSKNTLRSEEADTGGVDGVFGEVGADTVDSSSVSCGKNNQFNTYLFK